MLLGSVDYSTSIDMWGVGCIFAEMVTGKPLFPGQQNDDQLILIWQLLGTPTAENWPGVTELPDYDPDLWEPTPKVRLETELPRLQRVGQSLIEAFLTYSPEKRISADAAMAHPYFACLDIPADLAPSELCRCAATYYFSVLTSVIRSNVDFKLSKRGGCQRNEHGTAKGSTFVSSK